LITGGGGLVFKGSGFYVTDYKRAGEKKEKEKEETKQTSDKSESKGDTGTKPAKSSGAES
jgi:predicted nucleic acid-binding Zn ribbon protein